MSPEDFERIQDLFERGIEKSDSEREILLAEVREHPEIIAAVQELWVHANPPEPFLEEPVGLSGLAPDQPVHLLSPGALLAGRFEVVKLLGAGGMGEVYEAKDRRLGRRVAVKVLPERYASDAHYRARLEQEALSISSLSHPNICALHDYGSDGPRLFLVMEFVHGETLESRLRRGPLLPEEAVQLALGICKGLRHAHESGIVHRDLKPSNIMLAADGLKLLDFGIATRFVLSSADAAGPAKGLALTGAGQAIGTPQYMSPEQASGLAVDERSDVFSLGAVLFESITGERAFPRGPLLDRELRWPEPSAELAGDPAYGALRRLIDRCVARDPDERFASLANLERELREPSPATAPASKSRVRRRATRWIGAAVGVALLLAGALWLSKVVVSNPGEPRVSVLTSYLGVPYHPTLSPDGRNVAFAWEGESGEYFDIYAQTIGSDKPLRLTNTPANEKWPQWSPDGRWIAFRRDEDIVVIPPFGGAEKVVARMAGQLSFCDGVFAWTSDASHILFTQTSPGRGPGLRAVSIDSGAVRVLTDPTPDLLGDWCPAASPDGRYLFYQHLGTSTKKPEYHLARLSPNLELSQDHVLPWVRGFSHSWASNSADLVYTANDPTGFAMYRVSALNAEEPRRLPFGEEGIYATISRTGDRLVYMKRKVNVDIWTLGAPFASANSVRFSKMNSSQSDGNAEYSPDGRQIAFYSNRAGRPEVWVARADGSELRRLSRCAAGARPHWAPDGSSILVDSEPGNVVAVEVATGRTTPADLAGQGGQASYSRDGRWIYFSSERSGSKQVWRIPAGGGQAQQITMGGGFAPLESWNGSEVFFQRLSGQDLSLYSAPSSGGAETRIAPLIAGRVQLSRAEQGLYFIEGGHPDGKATLSLFEGATRRIQRVAELPLKRRWTAGGLSVAPDHSRILYSAYDFQSELILVDNFR